MDSKEIARRAWHGAASIYGTKITTIQVDRLFETWWKRNGVEQIPQRVTVSKYPISRR